MKWEYFWLCVKAGDIREEMKKADKMGAVGWELVSVTETIGRGDTSGGEYISVTTEFNFFFKRPLKGVIAA
jgi:hypothetical protein